MKSANYPLFVFMVYADAPGAPRQWWFGGGTDLTPSYIFEEDVKHFHSVQHISNYTTGFKYVGVHYLYIHVIMYVYVYCPHACPYM